MGDLPLQKISISGPTLASLIQRFSSSPGPIDGLLFGHVSSPSPPSLSDEDPSPSNSSPTLVATITSFLSSPSPLSFFDPSTGSVHLPSLQRLLPHNPNPNPSLIGWFSARRRTHLRPSMREFSVSSSLSSITHFASPPKIPPFSSNSTPCVFLLLASPIPEQSIHTHEYRAYEFRRGAESFEARSMDIVNIGPDFRPHYGSFSPTSPFPLLGCDFRGSPMNEDRDEGGLSQVRKGCRDQREVDGFDVGRLNRLVGSDATSYTSGVEDLYEKMLFKIENLARQVESSSAKVLEQEKHNRKLRYKILKSPVPE